MALVDTGSQISTLIEGFCLEFGLRILPWGFVAAQGDGGITISYKVYVEANLIPGLAQYNEDVLFLVISDNKCGERVPVQIGTLVIDNLVVTMTMEELQHAWDIWIQVHLSTEISNRNTMKSLNVPEYDLKGVKGKIHMMREVVMPPLATIMVKGAVKLMRYSKCMNVVVEPIVGYSDHIAIAGSYGVLRPGVGKVNVYLRNHSVK